MSVPLLLVFCLCSDSSDCEEGRLRLVDGVIDNEGRVEVCLQGVWGTIHSSSWESADAYIACKQLNLATSGESESITEHTFHIQTVCPSCLSDIAPKAYVSAEKFGDGKQLQVMSGLDCSGWKNKLIDCVYTHYGYFTSSRSSTAGILCYDGK